MFMLLYFNYKIIYMTILCILLMSYVIVNKRMRMNNLRNVILYEVRATPTLLAQSIPQ